MEKPDSDDALFQALIRKIPLVTEPAKLQEVATLALAFMLRRPGDKPLRDELTHQIAAAMADIPPGLPPERIQNDLHFAARRCIKVLQGARDRRLSRTAMHPGENWAEAGGHHPHHAPAPPPKSHHRAWAMGAAAVAGAVALAFWSLGHLAGDDDQSAGAQLAQQIISAAHGQGLGTHVGGGTLKLTSVGGRTVVIANNVPPSLCVAVGWKLVHKGIITINNVTPQRVSAGKVTELCNLGDGNATIAWTPKDPNAE